MNHSGARISSNKILILLGLLFLALRAVLSALSIGTNDILSWYRFAEHIQQHGLYSLYPLEPLFNHPPLAGLLSAGLLRFSEISSLSFPAVFRIPGILADAISALLIFSAQKQSKSGRAGLAFFLACSSLINILISSYHGNTDPIYAMLTLAAVYFCARAKPTASAILLGLALNIKIIPLIFIPALLSSFSNSKQRLQFILVLGLMLAPFLLVGLQVGPTFWSNIFMYSGFSGYWGVLLFLKLSAGNFPAHSELIQQLITFYSSFSKIFIIAAICLLSAIAAQNKAFNPFRSAALCAAIFAVFAPAFAGQYFCIITLLILAHSPLDGFWVSLWSGVLMLASYSDFLVSTFPFFSNHTATGGKLTLFFGFIAWLAIVTYLLKELKALLNFKGPLA